ncbi:MAG TPA: T3SS effector HopA1 family protein [Pirellulales bacterium]|jgi:hypothetical protein
MEYSDQLRFIAEAITFADAHLIVRGPKGEESHRDLPGDMTGGHVVDTLSSLIYETLYCGNYTLHSTRGGNHVTDAPVTAGHVTAVATESGWTAKEILGSGFVLAEKPPVSKWFSPGRYAVVAYSRADSGKNSELVAIHQRQWKDPDAEVLYYASKDSWSYDWYPQARFYFNTRSDATIRVFDQLKALAEVRRIPMRIKCCPMRSGFHRTDNVVCYVNRTLIDYAFDAIAGVAADVRPCLRADVPLFTHRISDGWSFAEDPGAGESFGSNRCRHVAEGIWLSWSQGLYGSEAILGSLIGYFHTSGISLTHPYLVGHLDGFPRYEYRCLREVI